MNGFQAFAFSQVIPDLALFQFTSHCLHFSLDCLLNKWPPTMRVLHLIDQERSYILSVWPDHCSLLFCKHSIMLIKFGLFQSFSAEILFLGLTAHPLKYVCIIPISSLSKTYSWTFYNCDLNHERLDSHYKAWSQKKKKKIKAYK